MFYHSMSIPLHARRLLESKFGMKKDLNPKSEDAYHASYS